MTTYTTRNRWAKLAKGEARHTFADDWIATLDLMDFSADGTTSFALSGSKTLTTTSTTPGTADEARARRLWITSGSGGIVTLPAVEKAYYVHNDTTGEVTFTMGSGTTCKIGPKRHGWVYCTGSACYRSHTDTGWVQIGSTAAASGATATITLYPNSFGEFRLMGDAIQQNSGVATNLRFEIKRGATSLVAASTIVSTNSATPYNFHLNITHNRNFMLYNYHGIASGSSSSLTLLTGNYNNFTTTPAPDTVVIDFQSGTSFTNGSGAIWLEGR